MVAVGIGLAVGNDIVAKFTLRGFDSSIRFTSGNADLILWFLRVDRSSGDLLESLLQNSERLAHLIEADEVVIEHVAVVADCHIEVEAVIDRVRVGAANIIGYASCTQYRSGDRVADGVFGVDHVDVLQAADHDLVLVVPFHRSCRVGGRRPDR